MIVNNGKLDEVKEKIRIAANQAGMLPGVYKMVDENNKIIYIGKAKRLKARLLSYSRYNQLSTRTKMMVSNINRIEFIVVKSEFEALLLENNIIKEYKPFYNVLLKDDKTFPYIVIDDEHEYPRIYKYRTKQPKGNNLFGPYPAISALEETIRVIQKTLMLRTCTNNVFSNRNRPCLQYFVKRCSAPCVRKITRNEYLENVKFAKDLLSGNDTAIREMLISKMKEASSQLNFELAATIRDRIKAITEIQSKQFIQINNLNSIDFIVIVRNSQTVAIAITFFRTGKNVGTETFVFENIIENELSEIMEKFITQFYQNIIPPSVIVTNIELLNSNEISEYMKISNGREINIIVGQNSVYKKILDTTEINAKMRLKKECTNQYEDQIKTLCKLVKKDKINRIETYDNSHIQGTNACGIMVVFEDGKIQKNKARKFNIDEKTANGGDDIQMMQFSLKKRFKSKRIPEIPDLIIIDGGKTQLSIAKNVLRNLDLIEKVKVTGIAKQNDRKVGDEKLVLDDDNEVILGHSSELLNFLIMLRNEAHHTAINFHRKKRSKKMISSILDQIPSVGSARKKMLLEHFGSAEMIKKASIDDLKMVKGIDSKTAKLIFDFFHKVGTK